MPRARDSGVLPARIWAGEAALDRGYGERRRFVGSRSRALRSISGERLSRAKNRIAASTVRTVMTVSISDSQS